MTFPSKTATNLLIYDTPIVSHNISVLRDKNTTSECFRAAVRRISFILINKAFENIPLKKETIETPLMSAESNVIDDKAEFIIAPILRAGLLFSEVAMDILPLAKVHHIGLYRDEKTLKPVSYYNNLPENFESPSDTYVYIFDPMLATGGSAVESVKLFCDLNVPQENITFISLISAPEGVSKLSSAFKDIKMLTGILDDRLNDVGYILPGLGDAGDRTFNTL
jgi:uracil phosphoribosyltransferase